MSFLSLTKVAKKNIFPVEELKAKLISKKLGRWQGKKFLPTQKAIDEGYAEEREGKFNDVYFAYEWKKIQELLPKKKRDPLLNAQDYKDAYRNIIELHLKLIGKNGYFHPFVYEIIRAMQDLRRIQNDCTKVDQKRIEHNVGYLEKNARFNALDDNNLLY